MASGVMSFSSCSNDVYDPVIGNFTSPTITAPTSGTSYVLTKVNATQKLTSFIYTPADYNFSAAVTYTLQINLKSSVSNKAMNVKTSKNDTINLTQGDINGALLKLNCNPGQSYTVQAVITSYINDSVKVLKSSPIDLNITPYDDPINYPKFYVPGAYQGWDPATANTIFSVNSDVNYEGYIYFPNANSEFKVTSNPDWNGTNYGIGASSNVLSTTGGNITNGDAGYYKINFNSGTLAFSLIKMSFGIIGTATSNSNKSMTYDITTKTLKVTTDLAAGNFKIVASGTTTINYGDNDGYGKLSVDGSDITIAQAGNYTITANFNKAVYTYTITKN